MPKFLVLVAGGIALIVAGVALAGSASSSYTYRSSMTVGGEVPKPTGATGAKGVFTATVTETGSTRTIAWKLSFSNLSGKAVAAHLHKGKVGVAGAVIVPLCGPCKSGQTGKLRIVKLNVDENQHTPMHFGVSGIPTMILFKDGQAVERIVGFMPKPQLMKRLQPHIGAAEPEAAPTRTA